MFIDENKSASLAKFLNQYDRVIMDTCSLMEDGFAPFMDIYANSKTYLRKDVRITVYRKCLDELKKHSKNERSDDLRIAGLRALKILKAVKRNRLFDYPRKTRSQNFADNVIYVEVSQLRITKRVLVITQDKGLAEDLGRLNFLDSQKGRKVSTFKLLNNGTLDINRGETKKHQQNHLYVEKKQEQTKAQPAKSPSEEATKAIQNDSNLWASLHNPNCPAKKKKEDISSQLSLLSAIPLEAKKDLKLRYSEAALKEELAKVDAPIKSEAPKKVEEPKKAIEKAPIEKKTAPKKEEKPQIRGFFGNGATLEEAILDAARFQGLIFRDPSVPYVSAIHGELPLTTKDLPVIAKMVNEGSKEGVTYQSRLFVRKEQAIKGFRVTLSLLKEEKKEEKKASKEEKPKTSSKPKKTKKATSKEEPAKGTLIVAVPEDKKVKEKIEKKVKKEPIEPKKAPAKKKTSSKSSSKKQKAPSKPKKKATKPSK